MEQKLSWCRKCFLLFVSGAVCTLFSFAQSSEIKGVVQDRNGGPLVGASILVKGTTNGTISDVDGNFTINAVSGTTLEISSIGYEKVEMNAVSGMKVSLSEDAQQISDVVVTAMGITRKASSLTYSVQKVGGDDLTRVKDPNLVNSLGGKIAGVSINKNSSGLGGSAKVSIRGSRSALETGNNQPLYVIDGVPMLNSSPVQAANVMNGDNNAGNRDSGDGISNINPEDIQSISVLKGASASALYGSQAANGVIMITTKKGHAGITRVTYSSNVTFDQPISLPEYQNSYQNWNKADMPVYDNVNDFFSTGYNVVNAVTLSTGNEKAQTYFSYANTTAAGIIDNNKLSKHNINLRETGKFFKDRLTLDGNINLVYQSIENRPVSGGLYLNPLVGLYTFPRGMDMSPYRSGEEYDVDRNMPRQKWHRVNTDGTEVNPYWLVNRVTSQEKRFRTIASISANLKVNDWLTLQARGNGDYITDKYEQQMWASTSTTLTGGSWADKTDNGRYTYNTRDELLVYGDAMAMFNKTWGDLSFNGAVGGVVNFTRANDLTIDSHTASLYRPNVFTLTNIIYTKGKGAIINTTQNASRLTQSVFATAQIGYKDAIYLDATARNDWSSTLYGTNSLKSGFFYPSIGLSWLIHNSFEMPDWINFTKVRASFAQVGNDLPLYVANQQPSIALGGDIRQVADYNDGSLKPEISDSWEVGAEFKFFKNRLDIDFTWYNTLTRNQFLRVPTLPGNTYSHQMINAGLIKNQGVELTMGIVPVETKYFHWRTQFNFSTNKNTVVELAPGYTSFEYGAGVNMAYRMVVKEGGSLGDIYGNTYKRDSNGKIELGADGLPLFITDRQQYLGNSTPRFLLGWGNTFNIFGVSVYFLIDARMGGKTVSFTQGAMDKEGVSKRVGEDLDRGYVDLEGQKITDVSGFYTKVGANEGVTEQYLYDATNVRLRELSIGYSLPRKWMEKTGVFKDINLSIIGRNLFFFYKSAPFDPDAILSVGNANQGVDVFGMPTTRSIGFSVKLTF